MPIERRRDTKRANYVCIGMPVLGLVFAGMGESSSAEKKFPERQSTVIFAFAPGETDSHIRPYLEKMAAYLGQPIVSEYKTGRQGQWPGIMWSPQNRTVIRFWSHHNRCSLWGAEWSAENRNSLTCLYNISHGWYPCSEVPHVGSVMVRLKRRSKWQKK